ncbi:MAG: hypothetical protein ACI9IN_001160 [Porticoccaceae bacterium]
MCDEDLERENEEKTSSVHFMRFEFPSADIASLRAGESLNMGIDSEFISPNQVTVGDPIKAALIADFSA